MMNGLSMRDEIETEEASQQGIVMCACLFPDQRHNCRAVRFPPPYGITKSSPVRPAVLRIYAGIRFQVPESM